MDEKNIIGYDFQGWPIYKITLREILTRLGAEKSYDGSVFGWDVNDPLLDMCPTVLEDDGMGYGINEKYIVDANCTVKDGEYTSFHIWVDTENNNKELKNEGNEKID